MKGQKVNYSSLVVSNCFNNNLIILYKQERLKISYLWFRKRKISGKVRGLNWVGKNVESLVHMWGKFPSSLSWIYKSNTFAHISFLNIWCYVDSGKCFLVAEHVLSVGMVSWKKRLWGWEGERCSSTGTAPVGMEVCVCGLSTKRCLGELMPWVLAFLFFRFSAA